MYHISIYSHYVVIAIILPFWFQRFSEESTFLVLMYFLFLWLFFSALLYIYMYFMCWIEAAFFSTVLKQHPGKLKQRLNAHLNGCSKQNNPVQLKSVHTLIYWLFFKS